MEARAMDKEGVYEQILGRRAGERARQESMEQQIQEDCGARMGALKVTLYLQRCLASKHCSASSLNCEYLNLHIKLKLIEQIKASNPDETFLQGNLFKSEMTWLEKSHEQKKLMGSEPR